VIESPTGCTKQLISVAVSWVPAAELMRPAGTKPRSCASRNFASQWARLSSASMAARARATRLRTSAEEKQRDGAAFQGMSLSVNWGATCLRGSDEGVDSQ
jgi:hypothetical protein